MMNARTYIVFCLLALFVSNHSFAFSWNDKTADIGFHSQTLFIENKGQIIDQDRKPCPNIDFRLQAPGLSVFIGDAAVHYQFIKKDSVEIADVAGMEGFRLISEIQGGKKKLRAVTANRIQVSLLNANKNAEIIKEAENNYHENYYLPQCHSGVTAYGYQKITYKNIYHNIDWVLYTSLLEGGVGGCSLKYDFVVHPGGNVNDIKLKYEGITSADLQDGALIATTSLGSITEQAPYVYDAATKKEIASRFVFENNILSIECADHEGEIIIDPFIAWSTYYGGEYEDKANAVASKFGYGTFYKVFLAGETNSFDYLFYTGAFQYYHAGPYGDGNFDGYVRAFTSSGMADWATYYGGLGNDAFKAMACDRNGSIYVAGGTSSDTGIATPGKYQTTNAGQQAGFHNDYSDGFIVKFDSIGHRIWGTYFGSKDSTDIISSITLDSLNNIYFTGWRNNPFSPAFLVKLNPDATLKLWQIEGYGGNVVTCDAAGNVFTGGAKFNSSGVKIWGNASTYATLALDTTVFVDSAGNTINGLLYRGGGVGGPPIPPPCTPTAFKPNFTPPRVGVAVGEDGLLEAINAATGQLYWNTYIGDSENDEVRALSLTKAGALVVVGITNSLQHFSSPVAMQKNIGGYADAFVYVFNQAARQSGSYFGGEGYDEATAVVSNDNNQTFVAGNTHSFTGINPTNSSMVFQPAFRGSHALSTNPADAFMTCLFDDYPMRFYIGTPPPGAPVFTDFCTGDSVSLPVTVDTARLGNGNPVFNATNTYTLQLSDSSGDFSNPLVLKIFPSTALFVTVPFRIPANLPPGQNYKMRVIANRPLMISESHFIHLYKKPDTVVITSNSPLCIGDTLKFHVADTTNIGVTYRWYNHTNPPGGPPYTSLKEPYFPNVGFADAGTYILNIANFGCSVTQYTSVAVNPYPVIQNIKNNSPVCAGDSLKLTITDTNNNMNYAWSGPNGFSSNQKNPFVEKIPMLGAGKYVVNYDRFGCKGKDSTNVVISPSPGKATASSNSPVCDGDTLRLNADNIVTGASYTWTGPQGYYTTLQTPLRLSNPDVAGTYYVKSKLYNCTSATDSVKVVVKPKPPIPLVSSNSPIKEGANLELTSTTIAGATYTWTGPNGFNSSEQNPVIKKATADATGTYNLLITLDGCTSAGIVIVVINEVAQTYFSLFPNPNKGSFQVKITLERDQLVPLIVINEVGQEVYREDVTSNKKQIDHTITLPASLANGIYFLKIRMDGNNRVIPFVLGK